MNDGFARRKAMRKAIFAVQLLSITCPLTITINQLIKMRIISLSGKNCPR